MVHACVTCGSAAMSVNKKLLRAVCENHPTCVKALLTSGADVNAADDTGTTTLLTAFENEFDGIISILIEAGANVNSMNCHGHTALATASKNGQAGWITALIKKGADVEARSLNNETALTLAIKNECVECVNSLIKAGADVNSTNDFGDAPLKSALTIVNSCNQNNILQLLVGAGADANIRLGNNGSLTPLHSTKW